MFWIKSTLITLCFCGGRMNKLTFTILLLISAANCAEDSVAPLSIEWKSDNITIEGESSEKSNDYQSFSDVPMLRNLTIPDWFKQTFLDLPDDLHHAVQDGKLGLMLYFGQQHCAYCEAMNDTIFDQEDFKAYISKYFDVIPIDVWGKLEVTNLQGKKTNETQFANEMQAQFTPTIIFYNTQGKEILRLKGYYPPYLFRAAMDYLVGGFYKIEKFANYIAKGNFMPTDPSQSKKPLLHQYPLFFSPPFQLQRNHQAASRPLLIIFEQPNCHACNLLHRDILTDTVIYNYLKNFEIIRLSRWTETPLITPSGEKMTANLWANELGIFYTPSFLFFDEHGQQILRVESVIQRIRFHQILKYILQKGYVETPIFERWISKQLTVQE
jgi:thioredoxin-related protein